MALPAITFSNAVGCVFIYLAFGAQLLAPRYSQVPSVVTRVSAVNIDE